MKKNTSAQQATENQINPTDKQKPAMQSPCTEKSNSLNQTNSQKQAIPTDHRNWSNILAFALLGKSPLALHTQQL
ncbi:hypothetical protein OAJ79_00045 [Verrucomicrobia bacterium]|nr:hypothetical protein [Verrucomicrobiota bacterium]